MRQKTKAGLGTTKLGFGRAHFIAAANSKKKTIFDCREINVELDTLRKLGEFFFLKTALIARLKFKTALTKNDVLKMLPEWKE